MTVPDPPSTPPPNDADRADAPAGTERSYGNMTAGHWSRTRGERNAEAIDYYRARSHAPGVAEGGAARNSYCMACDGVIPWDGFEGGACPHCGAALEGGARRYFNWVELDKSPEGDARAVLGLLVGVLGALGALAALLWWWLA